MYYRQLLCLLFFLTCLSQFGSAQTIPKSFLLKGFVIGADTSNTIPLANILKKPDGERYISNRYGAFGINVTENDTLQFSVIGYQSLNLPVKVYVVKNLVDPIRVRLKPITYKLKELDVNYNKRKRDSVARQAAVILRTSPLLNDYSHIDSWIAGSTGSPLTSLFEAGNSKLQEYYKLQRLMALYHEQVLVDEIYTINLIKRATGLDERRIPEFKKFCNLPHYFILNSNDYDLVVAIKSCYNDYQYFIKR
ncbi:MAG: carboxypeptidase-like regulatory domain-containing protein [Bacteroidia bacterium]|nr:carboxypeptidase-like regulatory domain-containing protein [Bacteroidia bacterium]